MLARKLTGSRSRPRRASKSEDIRRADRSALRTPHSALRPAFTLVELLVAIVIIAILAALILPAIQGARRNALEARVVVEIKQLESAIAAFKVKYGIEPPSRISIYITQAGWDGDTYSKGIIKRMWPQFDFMMPANSYPAAWTGPLNLNSGECLMFFLGGIYDGNAPTGFAKNPAMPFAPKTFVANREGPFMEFDIGRIRDSDSPPNGVPEYFDSLANQTRPFLYFSSYDGRGYRVSGPQSELPVGGTLDDVYRAHNVTATPGPSTQGFAPQKPQTFQIISPGMDNDYGDGGVFNTNLPNAGLANRADYDNLTNFHGGRLNP